MTVPYNDRKRRRPYVWVTWLTKLLAGEDRCVWRTWYRANFKYTKRPDDPGREDFFKEWTAKHDALQNARKDTLEGAGYLVRMEEAAEFKLKGKAGDLAGKPDIVAIPEGDHAILVEDAKSGRQRESDAWQVLIYLFALPLSWLKGDRRQLKGSVVYRDQRLVSVRECGPKEKEAISSLLKTVTNPDVEPQRAPSWKECRYCDVAACLDRVNEEPTGNAEDYF
jgi:hypothetical protein